MLSKLFGHKKDELDQANRAIFAVLLVFALLGLMAAFVLSVEKINLLQNPNAELSCNVNVFINCASVMKTEQATVVGTIPNSYFGMLGFSAAIAFAVMLLAGVHKTTPRWIFITAQALYGAGMLFAYWLFYQSAFVIQVLCPWCLLVTFSTTLLFAAMLRYNLRENSFGFNKQLNHRMQNWLKKDYDKLITASWIFILIFTVLYKFRDGIFG